MNEFNIEQARHNMIEQQIRTWEVLDPRLLEVIAATPRERFVPEPYQRLAFADLELPLGHGQVMMPPKLEARMLQALDTQPHDRVLEIGTGSGYVTACLARMGAHVDSVEIFEDLTASARSRLAQAGIGNARLDCGDAANGWNTGERYDVVTVTGSLPEYRPCFEEALAVGGRLFVIVGEPPIMEAMAVLRVGEHEYARTPLFETLIPPLLNVEKRPRFTL
jgi:protein-L-isoaspartate(D-aspartate) O-methyltransferase